MGRPPQIIAFLIALLVCLSPVTTQAQHKARLDPETIQRDNLPPSLDGIYVVYSFEEYKENLVDEARVKGLTKKVELLQKKGKLLKLQLTKLEEKASTLEKDLKSVEASRKRVTGKWKKCDISNRLCQAGSWKPWIIAAAALVVGVVGASVGVYYGWKYSKTK